MRWFGRQPQIEDEILAPTDCLSVIAIEHEVSQSGDASAFAAWLYKTLMSTPEALRKHCLAVEFVWEGYEDDPRDLWNIPEVGAFNRDLNQRWPCSLYFLPPGGNSLLIMVFSLLGATLVREPVAGRGVSTVDRHALSDLISTSWEPTLRKVAGPARIPDALVDDMLQAAVDRFLPGSPPTSGSTGHVHAYDAVLRTAWDPREDLTDKKVAALAAMLRERQGDEEFEWDIRDSADNGFRIARDGTGFVVNFHPGMNGYLPTLLDAMRAGATDADFNAGDSSSPGDRQFWAANADMLRRVAATLESWPG